MTKAVQLLTEDKINTTFDFKLTKNDLIDMIVTEQQEILESRYEELSKEYDLLHSLFEDRVYLEDVAKDWVMKEKKNWSNIIKYMTKNSNIVFVYSLRRIPYDCEFTIYVSSKSGFNDEIVMRMEERVNLSNTTASKKFNDLCNKDSRYKEVIEEKERVRAEMQKLSSLGQRAKAKLVRQILNNTEQGKQMLNMLPKVHKLLKA